MGGQKLSLEKKMGEGNERDFFAESHMGEGAVTFFVLKLGAGQRLFLTGDVLSDGSKRKRIQSMW